MNLPSETCPTLDTIRDNINDAVRSLEQARRLIESDDVSDHIESAIADLDLLDEVEDVRTANQQLREIAEHRGSVLVAIYHLARSADER